MTAAFLMARFGVDSGTSAMRLGGALGEERMTQRLRLGRVHELQKQLALDRRSLPRTASRTLDGIDAAQRRRQLRRTCALTALPRELAQALRHWARSARSADTRRGLPVRRRRELDRGLAADRRPPRVRTAACARELLRRHAARRSDHVERSLEPDEARQALRAAGARAAIPASPPASPTCASGAAPRDSEHASATSKPPPRHMPLMAATTGLALASIMAISSVQRRTGARRRRAELADVRAAGKHLRPRP